MKIEFARTLGNAIITYISPHCEKIELVGSIRREKDTVHDIDIVLLAKPNQEKHITDKIGALKATPVAIGTKICRYDLHGYQIEFYFTTHDTYEMVKFMRTGSIDHNIMMAAKAKAKGWHLYFDGSGLYDENNKRIAGDTEESIFEALGVLYKEPRDRK